MATATLIASKGAREVTREQLALIPCPEPSRRWGPVSDRASFREQDTARTRQMPYRPLPDVEAEPLPLHFHARGVLPGRPPPDALRQGRKPSFEESPPRNPWSLYNPVTFATPDRR